MKIHPTVLDTEVTDYKLLILLSAFSPSSFSSTSLSDWSSVCGQTEYLLDKVLHVKGNCLQMSLRCIWPGLQACGSDLVMWVQTEVWSVFDETFLAAKRGFRFMWLHRQFQTRSAVFLSLWLFSSFTFYRPFIWRLDIKQMLWKLDVWCHHHSAQLILMMCSSQACQAEFPPTYWTFTCIYKNVFMKTFFFQWNVGLLDFWTCF